MRESRRLKLVISYDGRDFAGWQSQKHGNTVQDHLEAAFERVCGTRLAVTGSGRTDSGRARARAVRTCRCSSGAIPGRTLAESVKRRAAASDSDFAGGICRAKLSRSIFGEGQSLPLPNHKRGGPAAAGDWQGVACPLPT